MDKSAYRSYESSRCRTVLRWLTTVVLVAASLHFARCYVALSGAWIDLARYVSGTERMPYQGRMLMVYPMRWAEHNRMLTAFASHHVASARSPSLIVIMMCAFLSLAGTGFIITFLYRRVSTVKAFWWAPYSLLLVVATVQYILHSDNNFLYPYDLPSLFFFTAGVALIYCRKFWPLLGLFVVATFNRETIIFLLVLWVIDACCEDGKLRFKNLATAGSIAKMAGLIFTWVAVMAYVHHRFRFNPTELGSHLLSNIGEIVHPESWPQLISIGGFISLYIFLFIREIVDFRLRMYVLLLPLWAFVMLFYGDFLETRVFGELSGLLALWGALIFEKRLSSFFQNRNAAP